MKKGELTWDFLGKIILALIALLIIIILGFLFKDKVNEFIDNIPKLLGLGG